MPGCMAIINSPELGGGGGDSSPLAVFPPEGYPSPQGGEEWPFPPRVGGKGEGGKLNAKPLITKTECRKTATDLINPKTV